MNHNLNIKGLSTQEAYENINKFGKNVIDSDKIGPLQIFLRQFKGNYLTLILIICTVISFILGDKISSIYIFLMIALSITLGFWNEYTAQKTVSNLLKRITPTALVIRNDKIEEIKVTDITIGDLVLISTGSVIPADLKIVECENLEANESVLSGESAPVQKNCDDFLYMGTNIESGHAKAIVTTIGKNTKYGSIAKSLSFIKPETSFQTGLRTFGNFLVKIIVIMAVLILVINSLLGKDILTSVMFSLAIAVGLTPELLPVVISISLTHGAGKMAKKHVIVKQLVSIENFGNMDVLCTDKTGTLTEGKITLIDYKNLNDITDEKIIKYAYLSSSHTVHEKQVALPIDNAIQTFVKENKNELSFTEKTFTKIDEEPFDYNHKASFSVVQDDRILRMIVKGAHDSVLELCKDLKNKDTILENIKEYGKKGYRTVAVASKPIKFIDSRDYSWDDAKDLELEGILIFADKAKSDIIGSIDRLEALGITLKILTGDNEIVTQKICKDVEFNITGIILGEEIEKLKNNKKALKEIVENNNVFAKVNPEQKLIIIQTLRNNKHSVGYLGDGINDAPALHAADVGISVNTATDVAKESASIVLLKKGLGVITDGVVEGRKTFNNTIKYILMGTSSNFGNMFSAAFGSFFLPFLPMTPVQILLNNSLYDISQITIPSDSVDKESLLRPKHWDINFINKYMLFFGPISSIFDFTTFYLLINVFKFETAKFQAGWFLESLFTQTLVILVIRTAKFPFLRSFPSKWLVLTSSLVTAAAFFIVEGPISSSLGFGQLPHQWFLVLGVLVMSYLILVDTLKIIFIKTFKVWN